MKALELKIFPLAVVTIIAMSMWAFSHISPNLYFDIPGVVWLSAGLVMIGVFVVLLSLWEFRAVGTTTDPRLPCESVTLVVWGIYRYSRNPMYFGFFLVLIAWGLFLGNVCSLLLLPVFIVYMNRFQIVPEERFMCEKFGDSYKQYKSEVRRWIGTVDQNNRFIKHKAKNDSSNGRGLP